MFCTSDTGKVGHMSCYHPLKAYMLPDPETGKKVLWFARNPRDFTEGKKKSVFDKYEVNLPCGQCIGCRMDYAHQWTNRLLLELQSYKSEDCHFVTLTYNDDFISKRCEPGIDLSTGELVPNIWSLSKREIQLFMKRLRKAFPDQKIRFYAAGEYGGNTYRPHYHLILFGLHLPDDDLSCIGRSKIGNVYYSSHSLSLAWPFGFNVVAEVTPESIGYTTRYMLKKQKGENSHVYSDFNLEAPFSLCSRKPGLGYDYYQQHPEIFDNGLGRITVSTKSGAKSFYPPKYFERLLKEDRPELAEARSVLKQETAFDRQRQELIDTDLDFIEYLAVKEHSALQTGKTLDSFRNIC